MSNKPIADKILGEAEIVIPNAGSTYHDITAKVSIWHFEDLACTDNDNNKFWTGLLFQVHDGVRINSENYRFGVQLRWGRIGTAGHSQVNSFRTKYEAVRYLIKRIADKENKGYVDATQAAKPKPKPKAAKSTFKEEAEWNIF